MLKLEDFKFGEVLDTLEFGHIVGGTSCTTGDVTCSTTGGTDADGPGGDIDSTISPLPKLEDLA